MIAQLSGMLVEANPNRVLIDVHGVGYEVFIPSSSFSNLPVQGKPVRLFTHLSIRDDAHLLFGFATMKERRLFRLVQSVGGIGPKVALNVLGAMSPSDFARAVSEGNTARISQISGLGKKTAQRIIVELKDKLPSDLAFSSQSSPDSAQLRDAIAALISLGYKQSDAAKRVEAAQKILGENAELDRLIKVSLASSASSKVS